MTSSPSEADPRLMFEPGNAPSGALNPFILLSLEQQSSGACRVKSLSGDVSFGHILINTSADEHFSVACDVHARLKKQCGFASSKKMTRLMSGFPLQLYNSPASVLRVHHWLINHNNLFLSDLFLLCCDIKMQ